MSASHWLSILGLQVATLSWTIGSLYAQQVPRRLPLASAAAVEMLAASVVIFASSRLFGEDWSRMASASPRAWGGVGYLVVFGSLVGFTAFAYCLNELPATTVGTYAYVNPVVAVFLGSLVLGEALTPGLLAGGLLIVLSVALTTLRKPSGRHPEGLFSRARDPRSSPADEAPRGDKVTATAPRQAGANYGPAPGPAYTPRAASGARFTRAQRAGVWGVRRSTPQAAKACAAALPRPRGRGPCAG